MRATQAKHTARTFVMLLPVWIIVLTVHQPTCHQLRQLSLISEMQQQKCIPLVIIPTRRPSGVASIITAHAQAYSSVGRFRKTRSKVEVDVVFCMRPARNTLVNTKQYLSHIVHDDATRHLALVFAVFDSNPNPNPNRYLILKNLPLLLLSPNT